ncbi:MAG: ammonium transporter [Firmicutes bacterium]|jgi:Amt family ammonium transporter|nr:ammonium transporter [Bacillota bacterium]
MIVPSAAYLNAGDNAWQLTAATFVGLQTIPGLAILYGGVVKKKWAINSAMMVVYAFSIVLLVWMLWGYQIGFGSPLHIASGFFSNLIGVPRSSLSSSTMLDRASIPLVNAGMPAFKFPGASLIYFQFVFAAITPAILAGGVLGRMHWKAWMLFVPIWSTCVYSVNAFLLWGGGWLAQLGAVDFSGGYVIHVAAGVSGFVAAAVIGPRIGADRKSFNPNNLLIALAGAGILWLGWNGFNGGDPYFANGDAAAAILNTNVATAAALLSWLALDLFTDRRPNLVGMINGMVCGLVAITPAAGYVNGWGAIIVGILGAAIPWYTMNRGSHRWPFNRVDDTLGVVHTHAFAGAVGGLLTGLLADPHMSEYVGGSVVTGLFYGNPHQFLVQFEALVIIAGYDGLATWGILSLIKLVVPLRYPDEILAVGDRAIVSDIEEATVDSDGGPPANSEERLPVLL